MSDQSLAQNWIDRSVLIIGAARQGLALAEYIVRHGGRVTLNDQRQPGQLIEAQTSLSAVESLYPGSIQWALGGHPLYLLDDVNLVCVSGGVPLKNPLVIEAPKRGIPLSNDSQLFLEAVPCKVIGITGSAGKTTTTTLVGRIAGQAIDGIDGDSPYRKVWVGGNIGDPLIAYVDEMGSDDLAVMELSSFQLEIMTLSPQIAAVLNVTPNHLDRHGTMEAYTAAKAHIFSFQSQKDVAVLGRDDPGAMSLASQVKGNLYTFGLSDLPSGQFGSFYQAGGLYLRRPGSPDMRVMDRDEIQLRGQHNLLNCLAACSISAAAGLRDAAIPAGVRNFGGVAHRLEFVRNWGGADWYNDSIATAPERVIAEIKSFDEPLILLAGGRDKNLPWEDFARLVLERVDGIILFGEAAGKILNAIMLVKESEKGHIVRSPVARSKALTIYQTDNLAGAVAQAARIVNPGDVVLLSPGGTSFDEFKDFEERGERFRSLVWELL